MHASRITCNNTKIPLLHQLVEIQLHFLCLVQYFHQIIGKHYCQESILITCFTAPWLYILLLLNHVIDHDNFGCFCIHLTLIRIQGGQINMHCYVQYCYCILCSFQLMCLLLRPIDHVLYSVNVLCIMVITSELFTI